MTEEYSFRVQVDYPDGLDREAYAAFVRETKNTHPDYEAAVKDTHRFKCRFYQHHGFVYGEIDILDAMIPVERPLEELKMERPTQMVRKIASLMNLTLKPPVGCWDRGCLHHFVDECLKKVNVGYDAPRDYYDDYLLRTVTIEYDRGKVGLTVCLARQKCSFFVRVTFEK